MAINRGKIVIIGAGHVGSAILNSLLGMNLAREIVLINLDREQALGEVLDASHTLAFAYTAGCAIRVGDYEDCRDAQIIINTAGPSIQPGEKADRMALLEGNLQVITQVMDGVTRYTRDAILINVTNPVDVLTYYCMKKYDYPRERILSTGTLLDTARFCKMLADTLKIDAKSVTGFVLGEHGGTAFIPWNTVNIAGIPFDRFAEQFDLKEPIDREQFIRAVKASGLDIIELKGYTSSGIALTVCRVVSAILFDSRSVLPLSVIPQGEYGLKNVAMSLPCILGESGIKKILTLPLDEDGERGMRACDEYLRSVIHDIDIATGKVRREGWLGGFPPQHTNPAAVGPIPS
ncbi:MAG: L-lactate dehydrogenase [Clostridia bacterium]|nr:L-lactate dehydrogenase [Clostridia bacterium]